MPPSELVSFDPCTDEVVWRGPSVDPADLDEKVAVARQAGLAWADAPLAHRQEAALTFAALVREQREDIARLISRETGKPFWETLTEADSVAAKAAISIQAQATRAGEAFGEAPGAAQALRHRPHGVLAVIGPFNFPMHLANGHIIPALLAGNAVLFKPSEKTPASGARMGELWAEAGLPEGLFQVLQGGADLGATLAAHDGVDGVLFTGGARAGHAIHRSLAGRPEVLLALELGGNNPLIAWPLESWTETETENAAHLIVQSAYVSAGQRCSCARRLILPQGPAGDALLAALAGIMDRLRIGSPFDEPAPYLGPVIDNAAADALLAAQARLIATGARAIRPLTRILPGKPFLSPGLIDVTSVGDRRDEEYFGPLLQAVRVADFPAAVAEAAATRYGLAAGLIGGTREQYEALWRAARAGVVNWNRPTTGASSAAPFGGVGASGNHRPSAFYAADYCAYPVASLEAEDPAFRIGTGLAP